MSTVKKQKEPETEFGDGIFEDEAAFTELAVNAFKKASRKAVDENDRLGIPTHGSEGGKLVVRYPHKKAGIP